MMFKKENRTKQAVKTLIWISVASMTLSSCRIVQPYHSPDVDMPGLYREAAAADTNTIAQLPWRQIFTDPKLQQLIQTGIDNNLDLLSAYSRIQQAQAYYLQSKAALLPSLDFSAQADYSRFEQTDVSNYQLGLTSAWELDIWGKLGSSKRAELANLLQTQAAGRAVQTRLVSSIAQYYFQLLTLDQQLAITEQTVENWKTTVTTMQALKQANRVTEAAVVQSQAQRYAAEVTIPDLKHSIREVENALSILLGKTPGNIDRGILNDQEILSNIHTGIPAQLLAYRPDVQQAELLFRQRYELTNVARTYFYPSLSITASAGTGSTVLDKLFDPISLLANVGAGLTQPIFNKRANKTRLEVAEAQQQEAYYGFRSALLTAGQEVSDALSLYQTAAEKMTVRENQIEALEKSVSYSQQLLESGYANYTEVITARQSLLQAELAGVNDRLQQLRAMVELYTSLGGGVQ